MKTHTLIYQMNCKMNLKYSQHIDKVIHNDLVIYHINYVERVFMINLMLSSCFTLENKDISFFPNLHLK